MTVVVPSRGRPSLHRLLTRLAAGETPRERFEVIVVLDGEDAVAPAPREDLAMRVLRQPHSGPARARNRGAAAAGADALAFIDDDCAPALNWVARMAARLAAHPNALIGGCVVNALQHNDWAETSQLVLDLVVAHGRGFAPSCNLGLRADHFAAVGGFDERFTRPGAEDRDFCDRWREAGRPVVHADDVVVGHHHDLDFAGFWRQHRNYGRGAVDYQRARRERGYGLSLAPQGFYPSLAAEAVRHGRLGGVAVSQVAYLAGVASGLASGRRSG
jgi:GT2 family glycosyltransferase